MTMRFRGLMAILAASLWTASTGAGAACGPDSDCVLGERSYRIALPDREGPYGAIVFMHGYRGTASGVMNNAALREVAADRGVALIAPKSGGEDWLLRNAPRRNLADDSAELTYFDALLQDVTRRFEVDPDRILATGFSAGGMMTWTLACHRSESFAAFAPIAGTFWAPIPQECPNAPVDLVHINGTSDTIVPMTGRAIADTRQGNAHDALKMFREAGGYDAPLASDVVRLGMDCEGQADAAGNEIVLCLHEGGHTMAAEWVGWAYDTFVVAD